MHDRLAAAVLLGSLAAAARAVPLPPNPAHVVTEQEVVYAVPGMDRVTVRRDVPYGKAGGADLALDLYYPPDFREGSKRPAVVFINGVGDRPGSKLKEWGIYKSWGRLVAASGWIGVTFEARSNSQEDIGAVFAFLRASADRLGVDADRIGAWACSGNVTAGLAFLMGAAGAGVRGAVIYYGDAELASIRKDLPVYFVRAGRDNPRLNAGIAELWKEAIAADAPWTMVNAPVSQHAFDGLDETDESRRIVRETLDFYRDLFAPPAASGPPSLAKKALSHWFGGREYPEAAAAYAEYVKTHPADGIAWMRLGVSQAASGDPGAGASLEKAVRLGADSPNDLYNVACGYSLLGQKDRALDWLERAVAAGLRRRPPARIRPRSGQNPRHGPVPGAAPEGQRLTGALPRARSKARISLKVIAMDLVSVRTGEGSTPGRVRLLGEVVYGDRPRQPETIWFDVPREHAGSLSLSGNPWLACLLPLAVTLRQPLRLCAPVDPELRAGADRIMRTWAAWDRRRRPVRIDAPSQPTELDGGPREAAAFFSGGVDSFYMVLKNGEAADRIEAPRIDRLISVWGFDIPIEAAGEFGLLRARLAAAAAELGKEFLDVATNLRTTRFRETDWGHHSHGGALAGVALMLERLFRTVEIAGTHSEGPLRPWGSHPETDPLFSTSVTRILHDGHAVPRSEKTIYLSRSDLAMRSLHVCFRVRTAENCCDCPKCYLAMLTFEVLGVRDRAATFRAGPIDLDRVRRIYLRSAAYRRLYADIAARARAAGRTDVAEAMEASIRRSRWMRPVVKSLEWMRRKRVVWRVAKRLHPLVLGDSPR